MKVAILWFEKEDFASFRIYTLAVQNKELKEYTSVRKIFGIHPFDDLRVLIPKNVQYNCTQVSPVL